MTLIELSRKEPKLLEYLVRNTSDANILRRVQALLWLDYGEDVEDIADQLFTNGLGTSRNAIASMFVNGFRMEGTVVVHALSRGLLIQ